MQCEIHRGVVIVFVMIHLSVSGCGWFSSAKKSGEETARGETRSFEAARTEGSLWTPGFSRNFLFQDTKARNVGDTVTVQIIESAKGSKDAKTKTGRLSTLSASTAAFLGVPGTTTNKLQADAAFENGFDGSGSTSRSGTLTAVVTAVVTEVLPNGNLMIEGRREVVINRDKEYITITGVIRPEDIGSNNTVLSTQVAEAKIEYSGWGVLQDKQGPGWLMRILDWIWPF